MNETSDLRSHETECQSVTDFTELAAQAVAAGDTGYARELLGKAEMQCQFPGDYVILANAFADSLKEIDYARDLLEQAEQACFEPMEYAEVANSVGTVLGDPQRARELLNEAVDQATDAKDIMLLAHYAENAANDSDLAVALRQKVEAQCKELGDFRAIAEAMRDFGDVATAQSLYKKAARHCSNMAATVTYARGVMEMFSDSAWTKQTLDDAEADCQFPKEFVELAGAYQSLLNDDDKVRDLLAQGAEFAMSGTEYADLADGYWDLIADKDAAAQSYRKALDDLSDRQQLLTIAETAADKLSDTELAKEIYSKLEAKATSPADLMKLASVAFAALKDREYSSTLLTKAEQQIAGAHDLIGLADQVIEQLGDEARAAGILDKALQCTDEFAGLEKMLSAAQGRLGDRGLLYRVLQKMTDTAQSTTELLAAQKHAGAHLDDDPLVTELLVLAEDRVATLADLKAVAAVVEQQHGDDETWRGRLADKLATREANQHKYAEFQQREVRCVVARQYMRLADDVMVSVNDPHLARKLFAAAEQLIESQSFDLDQYVQLMQSIGCCLADQDWIERLFGAALARCDQFAGRSRLAQVATQTFSDGEFGRRLALSVFADQTEKVAASSGMMERYKLARGVMQITGDRDWAAKLAADSAEHAVDHLDWALLARLATELGDAKRATEWYRLAAGQCRDAAEFIQLADQLTADHVDSDFRKDVYRGGRELTDPIERLRWIEGIVEGFSDSQWARSEYERAQDTLSGDAIRAAYKVSRRQWLDRAV
jgi:hypothetical protein